MGLSVRRVAEIVGVDISGLLRIERGASQPKRETAAAIYSFYDGAIPLGMIYDPVNPTYADWLTKKKKTELKRRAADLLERYPELGESDRRRSTAG